MFLLRDGLVVEDEEEVGGHGALGARRRVGAGPGKEWIWLRLQG